MWIIAYDQNKVYYANEMADTTTYDASKGWIKELGQITHFVSGCTIETTDNIETKKLYLESQNIDVSFLVNQLSILDNWIDFEPVRNIRVTIPMTEVLNNSELTDLVNYLRQVLPQNAWAFWNFNRYVRVYLEEIDPKVFDMIEQYCEHKIK